MDRNDVVDPDETELNERQSSLNADAIPPDIGVYDRPERAGMSPVMLAILVVVLLALIAVALFVLL